MRASLLICSGEPAGIGPDLCLMLPPAIRRRVVIMGDADMLVERAKQLNLDIALTSSSNVKSKELRVLHFPLRTRVRPGRPSPKNVPYILQMIDTACAITPSNHIGLVTAPLDKSVIATRHAFTGLTPYLYSTCRRPKGLSMFVGEVQRKEPLRVSFASMHLPLARVSQALNPAGLRQTIQQTNQVLRQYFHIQQPRLALCGLNPHAGEDGILGSEESKWLNSCAAQLRRQRIKVAGPLAADSLFTAANRCKYDAIIALFHDQGLAPFKALTFGRSAQLTFGLPFLRASPDHGTAYSLAARREQINCGSMIHACQLIIRLTNATSTKKKHPF